MRSGGEDWGSGVGVGGGRGAVGSGGASFLGSDSPRALHALWKLPGSVGGKRLSPRTADSRYAKLALGFVSP